MNMASSSSSAAILPQQKYDVFLSFRGLDTRQKFTGHLYAALNLRKINTYMDDKLDRGDEIGPALLTAIEQSKLSIIIFSENYASSTWCLDELLHILKCRQNYGHIVLPVFYDIDPSHVRRQKGSYADAFDIIEQRFKDNMKKVCLWRDAVSTAANLSGFVSQANRTDAELVEAVVNIVSEKLSHNSSTSLSGLFGIESKIKTIESLLCIEAPDVPFLIVGIWGMGGIGKTTLADAVFHLHSYKFDVCSFLTNVKEESERNGILHVRDKLLCDLLLDKSASIGSPSLGSRYVLDKFSRTKVLIVLDDVNDSSQLETLLGDQIVFGWGSRIIITSRDRRTLLDRVNDDHIYQVMGLENDDALQLFHVKALKVGSSETNYLDLSRKVVEYAEGNPLALKVLSSSFRHCNSRKAWLDELNTLKMFPDRRIQDVLRVSYSGLQDHEKGIFLDIACFFKSEKKDDAERMLEMHGFFATRGIEILVDMSLISISMDDHLQMHDMLQEMGRLIVQEQCTHFPGKRSRLWNVDDVYQVLKNNTGTSTIEAIFVDVAKIRELNLSPTIFKKMHNLKLLRFYVQPHKLLPSPHRFFLPFPGGDNKLYLPEGLDSFPEKLKYLHWSKYPYKSFPSDFSSCNLVELHLPYSQVEKLWNNGQELGSLKEMNLSFCKQLVDVPDLSRSPNIERIDLSACTSLVQVPSYFVTLDKLTALYLGGCSNLEMLPKLPCNLRFLDLACCKLLTEVPDISQCLNIETVDLGWCLSLVEVPSYFQNLEKLTYLKLALCYTLGYLPDMPCNLEFLDLSHCDNLQTVPESIYSLNSLKTLKFSGCSKLKNLPPFSVGLCSLRDLFLHSCPLLTIPDPIICLSSLQVLNLRSSNIERIPSSIKDVSALRKLYLTNCKMLQSLPQLPSLLQVLDASGCTSLKSVANSRTAYQLEDPFFRQERLTFISCIQLDKDSRSNILDDAENSIIRMSLSKLVKTRREDGLSEDSVTVSYPGNVIPKWFSNRKEGCSMAIVFPPHLTHTTNFLGIALCAVVDITSNCSLFLRCTCNFLTNDGELYQDPLRTPEISMFFKGEELASTSPEHVVMFFNKRGYSNKGSSIVPFNKVTKASFHFYTDGDPEHFFVASEVKVKMCGIRLLYTPGPGRNVVHVSHTGKVYWCGM